ncbi:hypothetical protein [Halobacteriovorax sp.]|uniref:hypothetical protein n=1 Tax=Halobacteriovorax sp. TaxID=2020862 RepID=UPI003AF2795A
MKFFLCLIISIFSLTNVNAQSCTEQYEQIVKNDKFLPQEVKNAISVSAGVTGGFLTYVAASFVAPGAPLVFAAIGALTTQKSVYKNLFSESGEAFTEVYKFSFNNTKSKIGQELVAKLIIEGKNKEEAINRVKSMAAITKDLMESDALCNGEVSKLGEEIVTYKKRHKGHKIKVKTTKTRKLAHIEEVLNYIKDNNL